MCQLCILQRQIQMLSLTAEACESGAMPARFVVDSQEDGPRCQVRCSLPVYGYFEVLDNFRSLLVNQLPAFFVSQSRLKLKFCKF